jgi:hypothetical protein
LGLGFCFTVWDERQREHLQIEPADSFGVFRIQSVTFDAMLSEFLAASAQLVTTNSWGKWMS